MLDLNKDKYLKIAKDQSFDKSITALHADIDRLEYEILEMPVVTGPAKQPLKCPLKWNDLEEFRKFSIELWDTTLA